MTTEPTPDSAETPLALRKAIAILLIAIALAMSPIAGGGFSYWDDEETISLNPGLNPPTWSSLAQRWASPHLNIYIPLTHTVWHGLALISPKPQAGEVGNVVALPYKLTNLCVHAIASVLVLLVLRRLLGARWPSLLGALAFAVHPVQVESVAWASGLKDVLYGMFSAACVLAYIGGDDDRLRPRGKRIALSLLLLVLACLSKPTAMVVPVMLLVLDVFAIGRPLRQSIVRLVPFFAVAAIFGAVARVVQSPQGHEPLPALWWRPYLAIDAIAFYFRKLIFPTRLAYDYGRTPASIVRTAQEGFLSVVVPFAILLFLITIAYVIRQRAPLFIVGCVLAVLPLGPVLGFTHFDFAHYSLTADHYLYLPMLGVGLAIGTLFSQGRWRAARVIAVFLTIAWAALSFRQSLTWRDARSVTLQTLRVNDRSFASWSNLALFELRNRDLSAAEAHARRAVSLAPTDAPSAFVLANVLQDKGDWEDAMRWTRTAIRLSPEAAAYHHTLAVLLGKAERFDESLQEMQRTLELDPRYPKAAEQLAQLQAYLRQRPSTAPMHRR